MPGGGLRPPGIGYGSPLLHADCMGPPCQPLFPGWEIEAKWTAAASGPDGRYVLAHKDDVTIRAWTAGDLAAEMRREDRS